MNQPKKPHGGQRKGAGAPKKYGEKTKQFQKRVPKSLYNEIKKWVNARIKVYLKLAPNGKALPKVGHSTTNVE